LWLGISPDQRLADLHADLDERLAELGLPPEPRSFTPHLTLGRHRGRGLAVGPLLVRHEREAFGSLPIDRLVLFESQLHPSGAIHRPLRIVKLSGADARRPSEP
jgi:2'-5' RNA ligase